MYEIKYSCLRIFLFPISTSFFMDFVTLNVAELNSVKKKHTKANNKQTSCILLGGGHHLEIKKRKSNLFVYSALSLSKNV